MRVIVIIKTTISKDRVARLNITKVLGGVQIGISCQVKRAEEKGKAKREKVTEKKMANRKAKTDIVSTRWKGIRKAVSMGQIL